MFRHPESQPQLGHRFFRPVLALLFLMLILPGSPLLAQDTASWFAEYYDNQYLIGEPKIRRQEGNLSFDWGVHSPGEGIPSDGFSARFGADPYLSGGTYRFEFRADDAFNFFVDHQLILSTYDAPQPGQTLFAELQLAAGEHHFQVDYREVNGYANLHLNWYNTARPPAPVSYPADTLAEGNIVVIPDTWYAQFYNNQELSGEPQVTQFSEPINNDWGENRPQTGVRRDQWSARYGINLTLQGGRYTGILEVHHDDGVRMIVDGQVWLDTWSNPQGGTLTVTRDLSPGPHSIHIEYNDNTHFAFIKFQLKREGAGAAPAPAARPAVAQAPRPVATPFIDVVTHGQGRVSTGRLNVRTFPDTRDSEILDVTTYGSLHPIVGRNVDSSWYQIVNEGRLGWVYARYLELNAAAREAEIPVTVQSAVALRPNTEFELLARERSHIRAYPGEGDALLGTLPAGARAPVVGRSTEWGWWQIRYEGMQGWVAAESVRIDSQLILTNVPVTED